MHYMVAMMNVVTSLGCGVVDVAALRVEVYPNDIDILFAYNTQYMGVIDRMLH